MKRARGFETQGLRSSFLSLDKLSLSLTTHSPADQGSGLASKLVSPDYVGLLIL